MNWIRIVNNRDKRKGGAHGAFLPSTRQPIHRLVHWRQANHAAYHRLPSRMVEWQGLAISGMIWFMV